MNANLVKYYINISLAVLLLIAVTFLVYPILFPCITAAVIAYLLNPLINRLESYNLPRVYSVLLILFIFLALIIILLIILVPIAYLQLISMFNFLISRMPFIKDKIMPILLKIYKQFDTTNNTISGHIFENHAIFNSIFKTTSSLIINVFSSSIDFISMLVITPLLLFYLLCDWPSIVKNVNNLVPISYKEVVKDYFIQIDSIISAYIRGQISVCLIMAMFYSLALSIVGLNYWLLIGFASGLMTFIPYVGVFLCMIASLLIAASQFDSPLMYCIILLLFSIGQTIEGTIITPLLIGKKVNLHPIWIIIGMVICASQIGFLGVLFSIPITAISCVFIKAIVKKYISSEFYHKKRCN